jgi:hypothetical protein
VAVIATHADNTAIGFY